MRKSILWTAAIIVVLGGSAFAYTVSNGDGTPASTLVDPARPDCPGQIVCPLTGEVVCRDHCPLGASASGQNEASCCEETPRCCPAAKK